MRKKNKKLAEDTRHLIDKYKRQTLKNVYESMPVSTMGADLRKEEAARSTSTSLDAARSGGIRGVLAAMPKIQEANNRVNQDAALDLDRQVVRRAQMIAADNAQIRGMEERREEGDLAGLGQQLYTAEQNAATANRDLNSAMFMGASMLKGVNLGTGMGEGMTYEPPAPGTYDPAVDTIQEYRANVANNNRMNALFGNSGL